MVKQLIDGKVVTVTWTHCCRNLELLKLHTHEMTKVTPTFSKVVTWGETLPVSLPGCLKSIAKTQGAQEYKLHY